MSVLKALPYVLVTLFFSTVVGCFLFETTLVLSSRSLYDVLKDQGGIIGALITCSAIYIAWKIHRREIEHQKETHIDFINRRAMSFRAEMPDALSALAEYARSLIDVLSQEDTQNLVLPQKEDAAINVFKRSIEYVDSETANSIFKMVSFYQVMNARFKSSQSVRWREDRIIDITRFGALVFRIFNYARNEATIVPDASLTLEDMTQSLRQLMGEKVYESPQLYQDCFSILQRRFRIETA